MDSSYNSSTTKPLYRGTQVVWYILYFVEAMLAFRFILKLMAANPQAGFSSLIYNISYPLATPFLNVFKSPTIASSKLEWTTLLAMLVYWMLAMAIIKLFFMSKTVSTPEAAAKLDTENK